MIVDVQFSPGVNEWPRLRDATLAAEAAGFGAAWVFDHLAGRSLRGHTMLEAFTLLGALAASTTSITLGTLVANVANREPGVLLVAAASVQAIAGRPFLLGLGAGASPTSRFAAEQHAVGAAIAPALADRHRRVEQVIDLIDTMWSPVRDAASSTFPLPHPRPTVVLGTSSAPLAALAGRRADGINVAWAGESHLELIAAARAAAEGAGRASPLVTAWAMWDEQLLTPDDPRRVEMAGAGLDRLVLSDIGPVDPDRIARLVPAG